MGKRRFSKGARKQYLARRSGPVTVRYLPGFEPPPPPTEPSSSPTKFPFAAMINGEHVVVWDDWIEWIEDDLWMERIRDDG